MDARIEVFESRSETSYPDLSEEARQLVDESVFVLEIVLVTACLTELAHERGAVSVEDPRLRSSESLRELTRRTRCGDLGAMMSEHVPQLLKRIGMSPEELLEQSTAQPVPELRTVVRRAKSIVAACPIEVIEAAARVAGLEEKGHRCRVAYDAIRAFIRRTSPERMARIDAVGRAYASGELSLETSAQIMGVPPSDALAEFEELGHWRAPEAVKLDAERREELLARLRAERRARGGRPSPSPERALRSALASARIEGVDARPWLRVKKH